MQRITLALQIGGQLAVGDTPTHGDRAGLAMENNLVQMGQRNLILGAVGDSVKGVASAQRPQFAAALHDLLHFLTVFGWCRRSVLKV